MGQHGFIDLQVNGWKGIDFTAPGLALDLVREVTFDLRRHGTLAYCPTVTTAPETTLRENLAVLAQAMDDPEIGGHLLGIHLEGPFISPEPGASGVHPKAFIQPPSVEAFTRFQEWARGRIAILTLAPEVDGALALTRAASEQGGVVSIGHHMASNAAMQAAVDAGARCATHIGNGLPNQIHRHQNPLWWQLAADELWGLFITDGHHLPPALIKVALRAKTLDRFIVTSDASPLAGMPVGTYHAFGKEVEVEPSGRIWCEESSGLAGSHANMLECMNVLASLNLLTEDELWQVGFANPLALLGKSADTLANLPGPDITFDGQFHE